ncbi:MAG: SusC/RagA family TonB-linked outer membrane protein [Bacteroidetes bacterium]|nr:MAG: SusC/RagA family TonB-linked outer membrane protein [Bacteroidota bacterium]
MRRFYTLTLFFTIILGFIAQAQTTTITGTVTSSEDNLPLPGVTVIIKESSRGTTTDFNGTYLLKADKGAILQFSFIGYTSQEITVGSQSTIDVVLKPSARNLDAVVVTALGIKRENREVGYTTESFSGDDIEKSNSNSVLTAMSGRSAGVQISSPDGVDGGTTRIIIRGNNNLTSKNQPLIVVDGVPLENDPGLTDIGRGQDWGSAINNINQADIKSIDILKGPTAAALYGSRGANGVVLITTKRGRKQKGLGINYSVSHKITNPYRYRDVQNTYGAGGPLTTAEPTFMEDEEGNPIYPTSVHTDKGPFGLSTPELFGYYGTAASWGPRMEGQMIRWWDGEMRPFDPQPDNIKLYFRNGHTTNHNLSFSGGNDNGTIRVSLSRTDHEAIIPNSNFNQTTINLGSNINISEKVKADVAISYINYNRLNTPNLGESYSSFSKGNLYSWPRSWKGLEATQYVNQDGTRNEWEGNYPFWYLSPYTWWDIYKHNTTLGRDKVIGSFALIYDITPWLQATGRVGMDFTLNQFITRNAPADAAGLLDGFYENELGRDKVLNNEFLITAHKTHIFDTRINAKASIGGTKWQRRKYGLRGKSGRWVDPFLYSMTNYEDPTQVLYTNPGRIREYWYEKNINSLYAFLNFSYDDYLYLELTGRNDWSSTLPSNANAYFYPSASLSFIPTEAFDFSSPIFNFWKLKGSIARAATDTDPYALDFVYRTSTFGNVQTAALPSTIPPIALAPQWAKSYEGGTTIGMFNDNLNIDFTYYYILSDNQILRLPTPTSSGAAGIIINDGVLENRGFELIMNYAIIEKPGLVLQTGLNISRNRNKVISLGDNNEPLMLGEIWGLNGPAIAVRAGDEYGTIVGYDYLYHENGQPILSEDGTTYKITDTRVPIGNAAPDFLAGWTTRFVWKGFTLSTLVDAKIGGDIYCGTYVIGLQTGQSPETLLERNGGGLPYTDEEGVTRNVGVILPGVYEDGTQNDKVVHYYFKYMPNAGGWGHFLSSPGILENTWIKMREISLSYQLPERLIKRMGIFNELNINLVGRNLFYIYTSLPDHINPEGIMGSGNAQGLEWASFPGTRSFSFGINASF